MRKRRRLTADVRKHRTIEFQLPRKTPSLSVPAIAIILNRDGMQVTVVSNGKAEIRQGEGETRFRHAATHPMPCRRARLFNNLLTWAFNPRRFISQLKLPSPSLSRCPVSSSAIAARDERGGNRLPVRLHASKQDRRVGPGDTPLCSVQPKLRWAAHVAFAISLGARAKEANVRRSSDGRFGISHGCDRTPSRNRTAASLCAEPTSSRRKFDTSTMDVADVRGAQL